MRRHFAPVHRFFRGKVAGGVDDDLAQRSFVVALERADRFRQDGSMRAFLLGVARLELLNHYRKQRRTETPVDPAEMTVQDLGTAAPEALARKDDRRLLARALRRLPLDLQIAVELHYWEQMSSFEIADVLDVPAPTIRSRLQRSRKLLEGLLAQLDGTPAERTESLATLNAWVEQARDSRKGEG
ncbi:MAG: sigma-70 family RNA polymerase sigma factor [Myxococcota bacterium]